MDARKKEIVNQYLTEALGECWHNWIRLLQYDRSGNSHCICKKCDGHAWTKYDIPTNFDFFTPEGFFKLWKYTQETSEFAGFFYWFTGKHDLNLEQLDDFMREIINPTNFVNAAYKFLKEN